MLERQKRDNFTYIIKKAKYEKVVVVLLHGYGADAEDLSTFHKINKSDEITWLFIDGPLTVPIGPGVSGRAWFPIEAKQLDEAFSNKKPVDLSTLNTDIFLRIRDPLLSLFKSLYIDESRLILGGFSQGAVTALDLLLMTNLQPKGVVLFSPTTLNFRRWQERILGKKTTEFVVSHGRQDSILPFNLGEKVYHLLSNANWPGKWVPFEGGHEIPVQVLSEFNALINRHLTESEDKKLEP